MAITFLCGGVSMVTASLSELIVCMRSGLTRSSGCCWEVRAGGGWRRTTIWALGPCSRMSVSSSTVELTTGTLFTSTSLQDQLHTQTCKNTACQRDNTINKVEHHLVMLTVKLLYFNLITEKQTRKIFSSPRSFNISKDYLAGISLQVKAGPLSSLFKKQQVNSKNSKMAKDEIGTDSAVSKHAAKLKDSLWFCLCSVMQTCLSLTGLSQRGASNALRVRVCKYVLVVVIA